MRVIEGRIIRSLSGFYDVEAADGVYTCKCKGSFRNRSLSPIVGDFVDASVDGENVGSISKIYERRNELTRPPVANADRLVIVAAAAEPKPNLFVIDKMSAIAVHRKLEPVIVFTKSDLCDCSELVALYSNAGIRTFLCSTLNGDGIEQVRALLSDGFSVLTGNSGVGKSSLINALCPELCLETNGISKKLGRGRHTTRCVTVYRIGNGMVADTPGFSSMEKDERYDFIRKEELEDCFPEFEQYLGECRFTGCAHLKDKGCAILAAVANGEVASSRHESYTTMYMEVKDFKEWDKK
ncbi:MAG: ribosome small subunit-dependent GTPase A [Ruminococcaceae bacterium]|nr:ribosome small subunit-dependent GTPase A [Oscillospiraceae bacterium]